MNLDALDSDDVALLQEATQAIERYGNGVTHTVGAAIRTRDGSLYSGVNVFAQGGGACAELVVLAMAISNGAQGFIDIVAVGDSGRGVLPPCGTCRQLLLDYAPDIHVITNVADDVGKVAIGELLPNPYRSEFGDEQQTNP